MGVIAFNELRPTLHRVPSGMSGLGSMTPVSPFPGRRARGPLGGGREAPRGIGSFGVAVSTVNIPTGERGTRATLEKMREAVLGPEGAHNPELRILAQKIIADVPSKDYTGEARAIHDFMHINNGNFRYTLDPRGLEWVQTPWYTTLVLGQGDCDDAATATCALATSLGHGCAFRTVKGDRDRPDEWSHVYAVIGVRKNGKVLWLPSDATEHNARFGKDPPGAEKLETKTWVVVPA